MESKPVPITSKSRACLVKPPPIASTRKPTTNHQPRDLHTLISLTLPIRPPSPSAPLNRNSTTNNSQTPPQTNNWDFSNQTPQAPIQAHDRKPIENLHQRSKTKRRGGRLPRVVSEAKVAYVTPTAGAHGSSGKLRRLASRRQSVRSEACVLGRLAFLRRGRAMRRGGGSGAVGGGG